MKKVDMIVKCPFFYTMEGEGVGFKKDVAMVVDGGKIVEFVGLDVVDKEYQAEEVLDMKNHAIFPGFIDAHMHTFDDILRGLAQDTNNWMMYGVQPFENVTTPEEQDIGGRLGIIEAIKAGTTTLGDYGKTMDAVFAFCFDYRAGFDYLFGLGFGFFGFVIGKVFRFVLHT